MGTTLIECKKIRRSMYTRTKSTCHVILSEEVYWIGGRLFAGIVMAWKEHLFTVSCNYPFSRRRIDYFDACKDELYLYYIHFVMFQFFKAVGMREGCAPALFSKLPAIFGQACPNMAGIEIVIASFNIQ